MSQIPGVCFVGGARYAQPLSPASERKFLALARLADTFVIAFSVDAKPRRFFHHAQFYLLPHLSIPIGRYLMLFAFGPVLTLWCVLRHKVGIVVAQSPYEGFAAACVKILARLAGRRLVLVVESHGDFETSIFLQRRVLWPGLYRYLMHHTAKFAMKHADLLRSVSESAKQQLMRWAPRGTVFQFPAWTDVDVFLDVALERTESTSQEILFAGVLVPRKGVHHLVNAFASIASGFPNARLSIVGNEENPVYARHLRARVRQLGLNGRIQFTGELPQVELAARMSRASVFVLPSLSEGLPRVVVEAMATGSPVIGSRVSGIPEMIRDGETGFLVPPGNEEILAEKLCWILEHRAEARGMGRQARAFARRFFSTGLYVRGYRQVFEAAQELLASPASR